MIAGKPSSKELPTIRDLTKEYFIVKNNLARHANEPGSEGPNATVFRDYQELQEEECEHPPPLWAGLLEQVRVVEKDIKERMHELRSLHKEMLKPRFNSQVTERDIELLTLQIQGLFKEAERRIKEFYLHVDSAAGVEILPEERRIMRNLQITLVTEINALSRKFREDQKAFILQMDNLQERASKIRDEGYQQDKEEEERAELIQQFREKGFTEEQIAVVVEAETRAERRAKELQDIERSMRDLLDLFKDLDMMVIEQGTVLDRIDFNVESTLNEIRTANKEFDQTIVIQKKNTCIWIIIIVLILILVFGVLTIIKLFKKK